jgi:hypothetical protein
MRALPPILFLGLCLAGCKAPPAAKKPERVVITPELIEAFRDTVYANYDLELLADPTVPLNGNPKTLLSLARDNERVKREKLVAALADAGSTKAQSDAKLDDLVAVIAEGIGHRPDRYAFIIEGEPGKDSFGLVPLVVPPEKCTLKIFGHDYAYELYLHDQPLIDDYPTYRARRLAPEAAIMRPTFTLGNRIYFDLDAAARIGRERFIPNVATYRERAAAASASDAPFVEAKGPAQLLALVKDVLRWRSLESFWATIRAQSPEDQVRLFAQDYELREVPRAVCEAYELEAAGATAASPPGEEQLLTIEKRACLAAIVHGEPLGQVATIAGLAADLVGTKDTPMPPYQRAQLRAARDVIVLLCEALAVGQPAPANPADGAAIELARLARAPGSRLQEIAQAAYVDLNAKPSVKPNAPR